MHSGIYSNDFAIEPAHVCAYKTHIPGASSGWSADDLRRSPLTVQAIKIAAPPGVTACF